MTATSLVWFRQDLRLADNPALRTAQGRGRIVPVFIWAPDEEGAWAPGAAARWWLDGSLRALEEELRAAGLTLVVERGPTLRTLLQLASAAGASAVFWNRRYEPEAIARDRVVKEALRTSGLEAQSFNSTLLIEPWDVRNAAGKPFRVFTPYWKQHLAQLGDPEPQPTPRALEPGPRLSGIAIDALGLLPRIRWYDALAVHWRPGERGAREQLARFIAAAFENYEHTRDRPDEVGTSRLSPHLHFGEIGPRQIWAAVAAAARTAGDALRSRSGRFLTEIGWREFAHHLLFYFPHSAAEPLRPEFARFPWAPDTQALAAWERGRTGIPMVDAGMRELWATGWMHNRVRMIVASFLTKNLLQPWQEGARWFWDTLVDADLASNTLGWQWTAGSGADAAPYFRVFNPVTQGKRFDPTGAYVRRWIPELAAVDLEHLHSPWEGARPSAYPPPIVDLTVSRRAALAAYARMRVNARYP
jgi:deoxyribodipyrimidine photo-lyase